MKRDPLESAREFASNLMASRIEREILGTGPLATTFDEDMRAAGLGGFTVSEDELDAVDPWGEWDGQG